MVNPLETIPPRFQCDRVDSETEKGRKLELLIVMKVTFHHCT